MDKRGEEMTNELALSNDLTVITAEINSYKNMAGQAIFEIGRRLKHVKENDLTHGQWGKWLESIGIHQRAAQRLMKIADELGEKTTTWSHLGQRVLYEIATLPPEERDKPHVIPSTGEVKTVDEMTVRELQEVKKALKQAEEEKQRLARQLEQERNKPPQVIEKVVEKVVDRTDYSKIEQLERDIERLKQEREELEKKAAKSAEYESQLRELKRELNEKTDELLALTQEQLRMKDRRMIYENVSYFSRDVGKWVNKLRLDIHRWGEVEGDAEVSRTIRACVEVLEEAIKDLHNLLHIKKQSNGGTIDAEYYVIESR